MTRPCMRWASCCRRQRRPASGVAFEPDGDGWRVSYIIDDWPAYQEYEFKGGQLANAYDLHIAAAASLKPLIELGERASAYFASRDSR